MYSHQRRNVLSTSLSISLGLAFVSQISASKLQQTWIHSPVPIVLKELAGGTDEKNVVFTRTRPMRGQPMTEADESGRPAETANTRLLGA